MPVTIIAEAGVNHNGDLEMAKRMALVAKECGADIVKYQTAVPELVVSKFAEKAAYQKKTTDATESQLDMIRKLHFSFEGHLELKEYCDSIGIQYLSAPFDIPSVRFLGTLNLPLIKIPSGEITNLPYLEEVAKLHTPVLLSTGMSTLNEITDALGILDDGGCPEATVLHCNTQYPTPYEDANLTAMLELFDQFGLPVGLSDHTRAGSAMWPPPCWAPPSLKSTSRWTRTCPVPTSRPAWTPPSSRQWCRRCAMWRRPWATGTSI